MSFSFAKALGGAVLGLVLVAGVPFTAHAAAADGCLELTRNLRPGMADAQTDGQVTKLQQFLAKNPDYYPQGTITGYFGPFTQEAVERYQTINGIVATGTPETTGFGAVGKQTRKAMKAGCADNAVEAQISAAQDAALPEAVPDEVVRLVNGKAQYSVDRNCVSLQTTARFTWKADEKDARYGTCIPGRTSVQVRDSKKKLVLDVKNLDCTDGASFVTASNEKYTYTVKPQYSSSAGVVSATLISGKFSSPGSALAYCQQNYTREGGSNAGEVNGSGPTGNNRGDGRGDRDSYGADGKGEAGGFGNTQGSGSSGSETYGPSEATDSSNNNGAGSPSDQGGYGPQMEGPSNVSSAALLAIPRFVSNAVTTFSNWFTELLFK